MTKLLPSQRNTPAIEKRILEAARAHASMTQHSETLTATFEHGHWWVCCSECGGQWDAVDATGGDSIDGFDFEEVTAPDEDAHREDPDIETCVVCGRPEDLCPGVFNHCDEESED